MLDIVRNHSQIAAIAASLLLSTTVQADGYGRDYRHDNFSGGGYIAIEGSSVSVENSNDQELNPFGVRFRLGMRISDAFDIEGHLGFTGDDDTTAFDEFSVGYAGAFLKGYVPVGYNSALFAMGGFTNVELTQTLNGQQFNDDRSGFSYGFGLETRLSERADLTADYMRYVADEGLFEEISAVSFGIKLYF